MEISDVVGDAHEVSASVLRSSEPLEVMDVVRRVRIWLARDACWLKPEPNLLSASNIPRDGAWS